MPEVNVKDRVLRTVEEMPDDISFEEVMERIFILQKIERGRQQIAAGEGVPHDQAKRQMKRWHE
jgi:hypothetical protein